GPEHKEPAQREPVYDKQQGLEIGESLALSSGDLACNKQSEDNDADIDQAQKPLAPVHDRGIWHEDYLLNWPTSVKMGMYIEMTIPPTVTPRTTIIAGSSAVMRSPTAASTSSS